MRRVAYSAPVSVFFDDWDTNEFMHKMSEGAALNHIGGSPSEKRSWEANAAKICSLLRLARVPDDVQVAFEYKSPLTGRVDCMLFGMGEDKKKHIIHIELKQWSNDTVTQLYDTGVFQVTALVGGSYRFLAHPSQQAYNYQQNISNYVVSTSEPDNELNGYAYCYNYSYVNKPNDLFAEQYKPIMEKCPLSAGDQVKAFAATLKDMLSGGAGSEVFKEFIDSPIRPSKNLMNAAANMFKGQEEFVLLDDQLTSSNIIFGMIDKAMKNPKKKLALIVKGGPGTGKTVIALKVLAELALKYPDISALFTTRSKALRNTLKEKLSKIPTAKEANASGLIRNIYDFKPNGFAEGEVDVLLIDEAHRIRKSSNYMADSKDSQTYLSQVLSLLYCSKVCVFFIDDRQGVNKEEIGSSSVLFDSALNYKKLIQKQTEDFKEELDKNKIKLKKAISDKEELLKSGSELSNDDYIKKYNRLEKSIKSLEEKVAKEYQLDHVKSTIDDVVVLSVELKSQFRCNGSDNYLDWLDNVLYHDRAFVEENSLSFKSDYEFEVCDSPAELEKKIRALNMPKGNEKRIARIVAGYCWDWSTRLQSDGDLYKDVVIGDWSMPWETNNVQARRPFNEKYAPSADLWASHPMGINQVGCIFSAQGFEVDYIGVILGPDIRFDEEAKCIKAVPGKTHSVNAKGEHLDILIKNIYRVLLSRGRRGCYIYCCDEKLAAYIKGLLAHPRAKKKYPATEENCAIAAEEQAVYGK